MSTVIVTATASSSVPSSSFFPFASASPTPYYNAGNSLPGRPDGSSQWLWKEQTVSAAGYLAAITYGLYIAVLYAAIANSIKSKKRSNLLWIPFLGGLFSLCTVSLACFVNFNEQAWIDQRNYPNGPLYFLYEQRHIPVSIAAVVASVLVQALAQGFLVYRCQAIFKKLLWITLPLGVWVVINLVLSILWAVNMSTSRVTFRVGTSEWPLFFSHPAVDVSMAFNAFVPALLLVGVAMQVRKVPTSFPGHVRSKFVRPDAVLVESALFFGIMSFVFVVLDGMEITGSRLFYPMLIQLMGVSVTLIVLRIVQGWTWDAGVIHRTPTDYEHSHARDALHALGDPTATRNSFDSEVSAKLQVAMHLGAGDPEKAAQ
ncbi:hypothetical protein BXZ70DRAFT_1010179 [Cristinia sonorae]|uniref:Uncharacterized protein n=1 Tax=Cristinia sonorae TaxID=1940300 RepID=A0A8K0UIX4_9AGAR|nr:hypothetical protein BXZ70DRAFT_1010179 [Cristinia sonorae]